jgi:hypothetical protein
MIRPRGRTPWRTSLLRQAVPRSSDRGDDREQCGDRSVSVAGSDHGAIGKAQGADAEIARGHGTKERRVVVPPSAAARAVAQ